MISIATRLRPFSHRPGVMCLVPGTPYVVKVFPALICFYAFAPDGTLTKIGEKTWEIQGPLKQFTVFQDLERGCVTVVCDKLTYHVLPSLEISLNKNPGTEPIANRERLSLGSHEKQEWEKIKAKCDFRTLFPLWFRIGSLLDLPRVEKMDGIFSLLAKQDFHSLFLAGFTDLWVPRLQDDDHQGIAFSSKKPTAHPLALLTESAHVIRSLFLQQQDNHLSILPKLPSEFFAGRLMHFNCPPYGELSLEWTKHHVRRMVFHAQASGVLHLHFPNSVKSYRLARGKRVSSSEPMEIKSGEDYLLDRFEK